MAFVQLVTFELCGEEYGADINMVNGIVKSKSYKLSKIPNAPREMEGIINLRGNVCPIFNLNKKFNLDNEEICEDSKIILINSNGSILGFLVDDVTDIFKIKDEDIDAAPSSISGGYIVGIGKVNEKMILLLDLIKLLNENDITSIASVKNSNMS